MEKYFITWDLEKTLSWWLKLDNTFTIPSEFRERIIEIINTSFNSNVVEYINYNDITDFFNWLRKEGEFVLSLDDWIYVEQSDFNFSSTRAYTNKESVLVNPKEYNILSREWNNLNTQNTKLLENIEKSWKTEIVIYDDWLFSWDTLRKVINDIKLLWLNIKEIRLILNFSWLSNLDWIPIVSMNNSNKCIDWLDERDLFYGTKNWWASFFNWNMLNWLSYISNPELAEKKASINSTMSKYFCECMFDLNADIWEYVWNINNRKIKLKDLPRISYLKEKYNEDMLILDILKEEKLLLN